MTSTAAWLRVQQGSAPLIVSIPHAGTDIPPDIEARLVSPWLGRRDADWWVDRLYAFADDLGATVIGTAMSRTVIDVNRDPSGASLYPGAATTELCPTTTFDGEPLYRPGEAPGPGEIAERRAAWFDPYHQALEREIERLLTRHGAVVLYDAHSIRSLIPRLFDGELPQFNIGTNSGVSCDWSLTAAVEAACDTSAFTRATNGRFKGGHITRRHGRPERRVHAIQMELACRGYMDEPAGAVTAENWPTRFEPARARSMISVLMTTLQACLTCARTLSNKESP